MIASLFTKPDNRKRAEQLSDWFTIEVERMLYVDRGREVILCDRHRGPVTVVVQLNEKQKEAAREALAKQKT